MSAFASETSYDTKVKPASLAVMLLRGFQSNVLLFSIPAVFIIALETALVARFGEGIKFSFNTVLAIIFAQGTLLFTTLLIFWTYQLIRYDRPDSPLRALWGKFQQDVLSTQSLASIIPVWSFLIAFTYVFTASKSNIERFNAFSWDVTFDRWDVIIHLGYRPWEILQPVFGFPFISFLVNLNYNAWFLVLIGFWAYFMVLVPRGIERTRFFLAFGLIWMIGGGLMATWLSSAGPCFYGRTGLSPDPYASLMQYLNAANQQFPIFSIQTQELLWQFHGTENLTGGISAMPSMHNATVLLFILATRDTSRFVSGLVWAHAILIFLGSVHFGWHYAVDAYISWLLVLVLWPIAHRLATWWESREVSRSRFSLE